MKMLLALFFPFLAYAHQWTIEVEIPEYLPQAQVYITGDDLGLCGWSPQCLLMQNGERAFLRKIQFTTESNRVQFKFTLGNWQQQACDQNGGIYSNFNYTSYGGENHIKIKIYHWCHHVGIYESQVREYELQDRQQENFGKVVFTGSSSIRLWDDFYTDLPANLVLKRGVGGAIIRDIYTYQDRLVVKYQPQKVFLYIGENDLWSNPVPQLVADKVTHLVQHLKRRLPQTRFYFISIKPSLARMKILPEIEMANSLLKGLMHQEQVEFIDVYHPMLTSEGKVREDIWKEDGLHMNAAGYAIWKKLIYPHL